MDVSLGTKEIRDLTRMERIGAHSHIRGDSFQLYHIRCVYHLLTLPHLK